MSINKYLILFVLYESWLLLQYYLLLVLEIQLSSGNFSFKNIFFLGGGEGSVELRGKDKHNLVNE